MDFADPTDLWSIKTTEQVGANNLGFYSRPGYDDLEHAQDKEFDPTKRKDLLKKLQEFYVKDPADITFAVQLRTNIWNPKVKGIINSPFDYEVIGDQRMVEIYVSK
jgi:ABC-type transport system substrate-binding protein